MPSSDPRKQDSELLLKGVICTLIGAIILLAPHVARSPDVRELMAQVYLAGWFALDPKTSVSSAAISGLVLLTAVQVVLSELIPKSLALQFPTQVALATVLPMRWSLAAFRPFITPLHGSAT